MKWDKHNLLMLVPTFLVRVPVLLILLLPIIQLGKGAEWLAGRVPFGLRR